ncbi:MAG: ribonuclease P protein component [Bacteroidales bacterium]
MPKFKKNEKLVSQSKIELLFKSGETFFEYPFKVFWLMSNELQEYPAQILISVPKRNIKNAVTRNLIKRRVSEIYRKNKTIFYEKLSGMNRSCLFALIYTEHKVLNSANLEPKIIVILQRLTQENEKTVG